MDETKTILADGAAPIQDTPPITTVQPVTETPAAQAAPVGSFDFSSLVDKDGFFAENWREALPEELRQESCLDSIKNFATMAKSFVSAQKMIGKNKIALPSENSSAEEWNTFYSALGRPESADKYSVEGVSLPEGMNFNEDSVKAFRDFCFENGLSQKTFEQAVAWDIKRAEAAQKAALDAHNKEYDETMAKLQEQYGSNLPARISQVEKALSTFGIRDIFIEKGLTNNYQIFEALANIGASISESRLKDGGTPQTFVSPQQQIDEIYADKNHPIFHEEDPRHDHAVAEVKRLIALLPQKK
jgi:hypothetical protein